MSPAGRQRGQARGPGRGGRWAGRREAAGRGKRLLSVRACVIPPDSDPEMEEWVSPPSLHLLESQEESPGAAGLAIRAEDACPSYLAREFRNQKGLFLVALKLFFSLFCFYSFLLIHGYPPRWCGASGLGAGCPLVAVGRRVPAGVGKASEGSSEGQDRNVFSDQSHQAGVRCDASTERWAFLSAIKSRPG